MTDMILHELAIKANCNFNPDKEYVINLFDYYCIFIENVHILHFLTLNMSTVYITTIFGSF